MTYVAGSTEQLSGSSPFDLHFPANGLHTIGLAQMVRMTDCKLFLNLILFSATTLSPVATQESPDAEKPNFVLIFIDDMGYGDIGPFGSKLNRTPNLDRMASEGMKFTSFYAAPVCSASRAQLMTGSYAPRVSVPGVFFPAGKHGLNPKEHTVADYLHDEGYATMCVGKWHLGDQPEFLPTNNGFDGYFGIPYSNDMARPSAKDGRRVHPLMRDDQVAELLEDEGQRRITREYTEEGIRFIKANKDKPFFLYMPHTAMHIPLFPHKDFAGKSNNGIYGDWVEEVDWSVGQILKTLRDEKLDENTLVIFTSDNGPWASLGKRAGVAGPLRGSKGCTLEGGVREPTIIRWPGKIKPGTSCDAIAGTTDILPTLVSLADGKLRSDIKIDGLDISPLFLGKTTKSPHEAWFYYKGTTLKAVRSGAWKLALGPQSLGMGFRKRPDDLNAKGLRLYNLDQEIGEVTDLAKQHPDIVGRLQKLADGMIADIGSGKAGPGVRPPGVVKNPVTLFPTRPRGKKRQGKRIKWGKIKSGDAFSSTAAPGVAGKAFSISCRLDLTSAKGVIIAHGGSVVGYSLHARHGKLVWAIRHSQTEFTRVEAPLSEGVHRISAGISKTGKVTLAIDDREAWSKQGPGLLNRQPQEDLCIGHDNGQAVDALASKARFTGSINRLRVTVK